MFTGELDDNRTRRQKELDRERKKPQQMEMFSQREIAQFGVNAHPLLPISDNTKLGLIFEDPRNEEEKERDRQRQAEKKTYRMFEEPLALDGQAPPEESNPITLDTETLALVVYKAPCLALAVIEAVNRAVIPFAKARRHDQLIGRQAAPVHQAA